MPVRRFFCFSMYASSLKLAVKSTITQWSGGFSVLIMIVLVVLLFALTQLPCLVDRNTV